MKILSISTSSSIVSVSISENTTCLKELNINNLKTHSETLIPLLDKLLKDVSINLKDINLITCDIGPGSFTGIRIGIATTKAIAESLNIPVVSVSSLEALAYNVDNSNYDTICALIDAKNNQVYCGIFNKDYQLIQKYIADDINNIIPIINKYKNIIFVGNGAFSQKNLLNIKNFKYDNDIHAKNIALCAFAKFKKNDILNADTLLPLYLRPSQAERMKKINGDVTISKMSLSDLENISDNLISDFDDFWTIPILKKELQNPNSKYLIAKINTEIVGFGGIWKSVDDVHITNIVIKKIFRGKNIGNLILQQLIELAKKEDINSITLEVNCTNTPALNLYKKFGFKKVGLRKRYYNNTYDAIIMTKYLQHKLI